MPTTTMKKRKESTSTAINSTTSDRVFEAESRKHCESKKYSSRVLASRVVFVVFLAVVAVVLGYGAYRLLTETENRLAREQFEALTESGLDHARRIADREKLGLITLASLVEQSHPDAEAWPLVHINGFKTIAHNLIQTSSESPNGFGFLPFVTPEELKDFEAYAYNVVMKGNAPTDRMYGLNQTMQRYNETDGSTWWHSPNKLFTPFYQHSSSDAFFLMNWHSVKSRGELVDEMIACSMERSREMQTRNMSDEDFVPKECSAVTDIIDLGFKFPVEIPAAVSVQPIYPANNPTEMTGIITSAIRWDNTLLNVFSSGVSGIDCVLKTDSSNSMAYTYEISNGIVALKGEGDLHDRDFDNYAMEIILSGPGQYSSSSPTYTLTVYPNDLLFEVYQTNNPTIALLGSVLIILFTSLLFLMYDFFVRTEFHHKDSLSKARRQFVRFISHEVRTPLNVVCIGLQLMKEEIISLSEKSDPTRHAKRENESGNLDVTEECKKEEGTERGNMLAFITELQDDILLNANAAVGVLNDFLNYDKVESGTLRLELTIVPIFELIERTVSEFRHPAKVKSVDFSVSFGLPGQSGTVNTAPGSAAMNTARELPQDLKKRSAIGDACRLSQVLRNLISNALKFTPSGGKVLIRTELLEIESSSTSSEVTLQTGETVTHINGGTLQIQVEDTGAGMTSVQIKNLFKEGVQFDVNELQAGQGSGLGLYIAKGIVEQHGGLLIAKSDGKGHGTTFTMTIPLHYDDNVDLTSHELSHHSIHRDMLDCQRILVVDDSAMNRKLLSRLLQNHGHFFEEAENGRIAVDQVKEVMAKGERFDTILMDYEMPEMDGCTAAKCLRAIGCDSFIVGITGAMFDEDVEKFKSSGANSVLPKPLDFNALLSVMASAGLGTLNDSEELPLRRM